MFPKRRGKQLTEEQFNKQVEKQLRRSQLNAVKRAIKELRSTPEYREKNNDTRRNRDFS